MNRLWAPWRMAYISKSDEPAASAKSADSECVFCRKAKDGNDQAELIVYRGEFAYVLMNLYPYNTGHLLIVPFEHIARYNDLPVQTLAEMGMLGQKAVVALTSALKPDGFNIGMNLGAAAGAGIAAHLHQHIVPRWSGDVNFMPVTGDVKVIPESLEETYKKIIKAWND